MSRISTNVTRIIYEHTTGHRTIGSDRSSAQLAMALNRPGAAILSVSLLIRIRRPSVISDACQQPRSLHSPLSTWRRRRSQEFLLGQAWQPKRRSGRVGDRDAEGIEGEVSSSADYRGPGERRKGRKRFLVYLQSLKEHIWWRKIWYFLTFVRQIFSHIHIQNY